MTVRCKFRCTEVTKRTHWDTKKGGYLYSAKFAPVYDGSEENKKFYEATPSGSLEVGTYKQDVFAPGQEYYIDITPAS